MAPHIRVAVLGRFNGAQRHRCATLTLSHLVGQPRLEPSSCLQRIR